MSASMNSSTITLFWRNLSVFSGETSNAFTPLFFNSLAIPLWFRNTGLPIMNEPRISSPSEMNESNEYFLSLSATMLLAMLMPPAFVP